MFFRKNKNLNEVAQAGVTAPTLSTVQTGALIKKRMFNKKRAIIRLIVLVVLAGGIIAAILITTKKEPYDGPRDSNGNPLYEVDYPEKVKPNHDYRTKPDIVRS